MSSSTPTGVTITEHLFSDTIVSKVISASVKYSIPLTGTTVTAGNISQLILQPAGTLSTLTIAFPPDPMDGQLFNITSSQIVTTLTVTGASFANTAPSALAVFTPKQYVYSSGSGSWWSV